MRFVYALCFLLAFGGMACPEAANLTESLGFITLVPPSTLWTVGAIVSVEPTENGEFDAKSMRLVCGPRASCGEHFLAVAASTISQQARTSTKSSWHLNADMLNQVRAKSNVDSISDVEVRLDNARIYSISDAELLESLPHRSAECRQAVLARLQAGASLTLISQALVADMTYSVKFRDEGKVDVRRRMKAMNAVAISLGGGHQQLNEKTIVSRGLAIGIKTDSFLMVLGSPELARERGIAGQSDFDDAGFAAQMHQTETGPPLAPVISPPGGPVQPVWGP